MDGAAARGSTRRSRLVAPQSWPDFVTRLVPMFARYRAFGLRYADSLFGIDGEFARHRLVSARRCPRHPSSRTPRSYGHSLYPGRREPNASSTLYSPPFEVATGTEIRAATFLGAEQVSRSWRRRLDERTGRAAAATSSIFAAMGSAFCSNRPLARERRRAARGRHHESVLDLSRRRLEGRTANRRLGGRAAFQLRARRRCRQDPRGRCTNAWASSKFMSTAAIRQRLQSCHWPPQPAASNYRAAGERLPPLPGRHDVCLRFARPRLDPMWALDWVEIGE